MMAVKSADDAIHALSICGRVENCCVECPYHVYPGRMGNFCKETMHSDILLWLTIYKDRVEQLENKQEQK